MQGPVAGTGHLMHADLKVLFSSISGWSSLANGQKLYHGFWYATKIYQKGIIGYKKYTNPLQEKGVQETKWNIPSQILDE